MIIKRGVLGVQQLQILAFHSVQKLFLLKYFWTKKSLPNQYRDGLTNPENWSPILAQDFDFLGEGFNARLGKKIIQDNSPKSHDNLEDLGSELQKLLDEFKIPTPALRQVNTKQSFKVKEADSGDTTSKSDAVDLSEFPNGLELGNDQTEESSKLGIELIKTE